MILSNQEMIDRITRWQEAGYVHPLTCANDSGHELLEPDKKITALGVVVVLECLTCDYEQTFIPDVFYRQDYDTFMKWWGSSTTWTRQEARVM